MIRRATKFLRCQANLKKVLQLLQRLELLLLELDVHFERRIIVVTVSPDEPEVPDEPSKPVDTSVIQPEQFSPEQSDDDDDDRYEEDDRKEESDDDWSGDDDDDSDDSDSGDTTSDSDDADEDDDND